MVSRNTLLHALADDHGCRVWLRASEWLGLATVEWSSDSGIRRQTIVLNEGDYDLLAEGWEDGQGRSVCFDNAEVQA